MINDDKRVFICRFTLVLIKINCVQFGDRTGLFYTTNPIFILVEINDFYRICPDFFHLSHRTTVIQDLLVRRQFSLVLDNQTNVNVEA